MKKIIRCFVFCLLILSISVTGFVFDWNFEYLKTVTAVESQLSENSEQQNISIFIRKPTYSVFYENKLYFIDEADKLLKIYNTENNTFESNYIDLNSLTIVDSSFIEKSWYLLTKDVNSKNRVIKVDLETFKISKNNEFDLLIENKYSSLFAQKINFEEKNYTFLTFTAEHENSKGVLINEESGLIESAIEIKLGSSHEDIKNSLQKTITYQDSSGKLHIVFIYDKDIAYFSVNSIDSLRDLASDGNIVNTMQHTSIQDIQQLNIKNVSISKINNVDYLAISLCSGNNRSQQINFYSFDFNDYLNTIKYETKASCKNAEWLNFNNNYFSFVDTDEQKLYFTKMLTNEENGKIKFGQLETNVDNPQYKIEYFNANSEDNTEEKPQEFIYKKAKTATALYNDPWGAIATIYIPENTNVIQIGKAKIIGSNSEIKDYDYCLYTYQKDNGYSVNQCGFIESSTLEAKDFISPNDAGFKEISGKYRVAIWPRTVLNNLPTTVLSEFIEKPHDNINENKFPKIPNGELIDDNLDVYIIDMLGSYVTNNVQMVKVEVNGKIGYIDSKCIRNPSDIKNFVITNATIKNDETVVYSSASFDSTTLSFKLEKGKNVRINGKRDTKTGFTSITFNDEFGNEYSGYIETDYLKADSWSTLQIVGCILIAINIGLLILILFYKKNHLGNRGQKIDNNQ